MNLTKIQKVKNHIDIKDKLLDLISNTPGEMYTSTSKTDLNYNITFSDWSVKKDHDYKKYYLEQIFPYFENMQQFINCCKSVIHNVWFHQYNKHDFHDWHIHGGCHFASVYYLELPNKKYATEFYDFENKKTIKYNMQEGDLIIFPSYIPHRAVKVLDEGRKTIISANYSLELLDKKFYEEELNK